MSAPDSPDTAQRASEALLERKDELAVAMTEALYAAMPALGPRYGEHGRAKCLQDMRYNLEHLAPAVALAEPALFAKYARWLADLLRPRGIPDEHVVATLNTFVEVLGARLAPDEYAAVVPSLEAGIAAVAAQH